MGRLENFPVGLLSKQLPFRSFKVFLPEKTYVVLCKIQLKILWKERCKNI